MTQPSPETLRSRATDAGQGHLFRFWDVLDAAQRAALLADVASIDFAEVAAQAGVTGAQDSSGGPHTLPSFEPAPCLPACSTAGGSADYSAARQIGESLIAEGRVAAMVVAGGQGTRLGFDGPKGLFRISPVRSKSLFRLFAEGILATQRRFGRRIAWYVMTSPTNDADTQAYFRGESWFGLDPSDVVFFRQGVMPALSPDGKILLSDRHRVALSPDGHGGSLTALSSSGCLRDMAARGVSLLSYFQVDNPLVRPVDPVLVGLHAQHEAQASTLTISKADDLERVGNFVRIGDRIHVIEYTELPESAARTRGADGGRKFDAANLSIFTFSREFLESITGGGRLTLPWHRARKKVPCIDLDSGRVVAPSEPNAIKLERFVFDALPLAERVVLLRGERGECFSPVKNAEGDDSVATARRDMSRRAARWLRAAGIAVPVDAGGVPGAACEVSPLAAQDAGELAEFVRKSKPVVRLDEAIYLDADA